MPRLDHVAFEVSDLDASIAFYTEKLGLKLLSRDVDEQHHEAFAFLELDGGNLELLQVLGNSRQPKRHSSSGISASCCPHAAIETDDMERLVAMLNRQKVPIVKGPLEIPDTVRWVYISDPDNNVIEFVQWLKPSP